MRTTICFFLIGCLLLLWSVFFPQFIHWLLPAEVCSAHSKSLNMARISLFAITGVFFLFHFLLPPLLPVARLLPVEILLLAVLSIVFAVSIGFMCRGYAKGYLVFLYIFIVLGSMGYMVYDLFSQSGRTQVWIENHTLHTSGDYPLTLSLEEDILHAELTDTLPAIDLRIDGVSFGGLRAGWFRLKSKSNVFLCLKTSTAPFVRIERKNDCVIFLNLDTPEETRRLYGALSQELSHIDEQKNTVP